MHLKTLKTIIHDLQTIIERNPEVADVLVGSIHSTIGCDDRPSRFSVSVIDQCDMDSDFSPFYKGENIKVGDKVLQLSVGN
jgi:hypothetical protein